MKARKTLLIASAVMTLLGTGLTSAAYAGPHGHHGPAGAYHSRYEPGRWHDGHWAQTWHGGRYGWWWLAGTTWLLYSTPVYPYPETEPVYVIDDDAATPAPATAETPAAQVWYYCSAVDGYYPAVPDCPSGWQTVPATPPQE